jgi:ADP-ribose pyrophosphatase YjhB (NUDIX family)
VSRPDDRGVPGRERREYGGTHPRRPRTNPARPSHLSRDEPWALPGGWLERAEGTERGPERKLLEESVLRVRVSSVKAVERGGSAIGS